MGAHCGRARTFPSEHLNDPHLVGFNKAGLTTCAKGRDVRAALRYILRSGPICRTQTGPVFLRVPESHNRTAIVWLSVCRTLLTVAHRRADLLLFRVAFSLSRPSTLFIRFPRTFRSQYFFRISRRPSGRAMGELIRTTSSKIHTNFPNDP
jgi:hypothetical protein